jgi:uroporphyrinogen III methyltransferase/synthase
MDKRPTGMVTLIGAGPGDPGLITVKGLKALHECDVVVYDNLIPDELIVSLPGRIERQYVGKKAGHHSLSQDRINQLMVDLVRSGKKVARLKGGDPFVFGRGGEEARYLKVHGVRYEVIPGVTAGVAGLGYGGIPCTDRTEASSVTFVTGHRALDKEQPTVSWNWLAGLTGGTLVIYMGVGEIEIIVGRLISSGMSPQTPSAVIERATLPTQRVVTSTLLSLPQTVKSNDVKPPALVVIGEVVNLRSLVDWFDGKPLVGLRVMVTRPADQAGQLYASLRDLGAEPMSYPTIATRENIDQKAWTEIKDATADNGVNRWLVFTSENGVRYFLRQVREQVGDIRWLGNFKIAAIGSGTERALKRFSLKADFMPSVATVAELAHQMAAELCLTASQVIRVQGNLSDETVTNVLTKAGASVTGLTVYETYTPAWPDEFKEKLLESPPDVIMFSSGSTASGLCEHLSKKELAQVSNKATIVTIGPMTSKVVESSGMKVTLETKEHSIPAMIEALLEYYRENPIGGRK